MKTTYLLIITLISFILMSCATFDVTDRDKKNDDNQEEKSNGFTISGTTTDPVSIIVAKGDYDLKQAETDRMREISSAEAIAIVLNAQSQAKLTEALAEAILEAQKVFGDNPKYIQEVSDWIKDYAYVKFSESTGNRYNMQQMMPFMQYEYDQQRRDMQIRARNIQNQVKWRNGFLR